MNDSPDQVEEQLLNFLGDDPKSPRQVRTLMTKRLAKDSRSAAAWNARAWANFELGEYSDAIADATKAIELCPEAYLPWHFRGASFWRLGDTKQAEPDLGQAIERASGVKLFLEETYLFRGGLRCNEKRIDEAMNDLNQCLKLHPQNTWGYVFRANAFCHRQEYKRAMTDLKKAIKLDPDDGYAPSTMAWLLATCLDPKIRDGHRALKFAEQANELSDNEYLADEAAAYAELGQFKEAVKLQKRAIKRCDDPSEKKQMIERLKKYESNQPHHALWGD